MLKIAKGEISFDNEILLSDINLEINSSEINVIIGPNGIGKTTLLNILAGNKKLTDGAFYNNFERNILIPQNLYYPDDITLFEYVSSVFFKENFKWFLSKEDKTNANHVLDKLKLLKKADYVLKNLSAGELQLANIALCLLSEAKFLLLDEPTSNLDLVNQVMILDMIKELSNQGMSVVIVMHDIHLASKYGDKFVLISQNGNISQGIKSEILTNEMLSEAYNIDFKKLGIYENSFA